MQAKKAQTTAAFSLSDFLDSTPHKIAFKKIEVHQTISFPGIIGNDKSILVQKYPGLKIWRTPVGYVLERNNSYAVIEHQNVIGGIVDG